MLRNRKPPIHRHVAAGPQRQSLVPDFGKLVALRID
jgi:hypothetical protein